MTSRCTQVHLCPGRAARQDIRRPKTAIVLFHLFERFELSSKIGGRACVAFDKRILSLAARCTRALDDIQWSLRAFRQFAQARPGVKMSENFLNPVSVDGVLAPAQGVESEADVLATSFLSTVVSWIGDKASSGRLSLLFLGPGLLFLRNITFFLLSLSGTTPVGSQLCCVGMS